MTSRLERMIRRLSTQAALLGHAAELIAALPGPLLEFGLGKGRTYDHLRALLPEREIFAFDREIHCPPDCLPDARHLILGDFEATLTTVRLPAPAALAHFDIGSEDRAEDARLAARLGPAAAPLLAPGAVVVTDRAMAVAAWRPLPRPPGADDSHFLYRAAG